MSRTFGERINQFVLSIDLLDEDTFFDLLRLIHEYVRRHLDITYLSVLVETQIDEWQGLRTLRSTREEAPSYVVDEAVGAGYRSHSAYTYGCDLPIWVLSKSKASSRMCSLRRSPSRPRSSPELRLGAVAIPRTIGWSNH